MEKSQRQQNTPAQTGGRSRNGKIDNYSLLLNSSLRLLQIRPRSIAEIQIHLKKKSAPEDIIQEVISKLKELKYLDDIKFSQWLIDSRQRTRPRGSRLLIQELKNKGVKDFPTNVVFPDDSQAALNAITPKLKKWHNLPYPQFYAKAGRFLQSRGFSWDTIVPVIKKAYNSDNVS